MRVKGKVLFGDEDHPGERGPGRPVEWHPTKEMFARIMELIKGGETIRSLGYRPDMPSHVTIHKWLAKYPDFAEMMEEATLWRPPIPRKLQFDQDVADEIARRVADGELLSSICRDEAMPCYATIRRWQKRLDHFAVAMRRAKHDAYLKRREQERCTTTSSRSSPSE